jgi:hypothetical protein
VVPVERHDVEALFEVSRLRHHRHVQVAVVQQLAETAGHALAQGDLDPRVVAPEAVEGADRAQRPDRAHEAHVQGRVLELEEALGRGPCRLGLLPDLLQLRAHQASEVDQMGQVPLGPEQKAAQLLLELLDGAGQDRLRDIASLGGAREIDVSHTARK